MVVEISSSRVFNWMVQKHLVNLASCLPYLEGGRILAPNGAPIQEGREENERYHGALILCNGDTLFNRLFSDHVAEDTERDEFHDVRNQQGLLEYLAGQLNPDGAYVFDGKNDRVARVFELNNTPPTLPKGLVLSHYVPPTFCSYDGSVPVAPNIGTKTRLAIKIPQAYPGVEAVQLKRTGYTPLGMGLVTRLSDRGLLEAAFFKYEPGSPGPFVSDEHPILLVHQQYEMRDGRVVPVGLERVISVDTSIEDLVRPEQPYQRSPSTPLESYS